MAWAEFRPTKSGTARKFNKKKGVWETGSYYPRERIGGRVKSCPAGSTLEGRKEGIADLEKERRDYKSGKGKKKSPPLSEAYSKFEITIKKDDTKSPNTWKAYKNGIDKFMEFAEDTQRPVDSVLTEEMIEFRTEIMQKHNTNGMINILKYVRTFFSFCGNSGYTEENPVTNALKGFKEKLIASYLEINQVREILSLCFAPEDSIGSRAAAKREFLDIMSVTLSTGLREFEIASLETSKLRKPKISVLGKGRKWRSFPIMDILVWEILDRWSANGDTLVFSGWSKDRIRQYWGRLIKKARKFGMKLPKRCRFHDLRHTFASNYLMDGGRIEDLKEILGHENIATTQRYSHIQQSHLEVQMAKMKNEFLRPKPAQLAVV